MTCRLRTLILLLASLLPGTSLARAQGGSTAASLSGMVVDSSGALIPGVDIVATNNATGVKYTTVTGDNGSFTIPVLPGGTYTVTVSLMGFKTTSLTDITVNAAVPASVRIVLEVGNLSETVTVTGGTEVLQTQSSTVSTTITANQVNSVPLVNPDAMNFISRWAAEPVWGLSGPNFGLSAAPARHSSTPQRLSLKKKRTPQ